MEEDISRYSEEDLSRQFPSFTLTTKQVGSNACNECVQLTFICTSARNVEAAEWVDAVVRARGEAIRAKTRVDKCAAAGHPDQVGQNNQTTVPRLANAPVNASSPQPISNKIMLTKWNEIDALTIPIDVSSSKSDGTRRALVIDRRSTDYQEI